MRLESLRLHAFGHFSEVELDFSACPAVHMVYGRNEAGKSTTLRAISGLLYGIPVNTTDAHVHKMGELLVGARLSHHGNAIDVVRRKGAKNTLLDAATREPLAEQLLRGMLAGVDEATFGAMFGLDHESLRRGAEALLHGGGAVGESLFEAGAGGRGIQSVLLRLAEEADELYRPRGRRQKINEALRSVKEARERRVAACVRPEAWVLQVDDLDRCRAELAAASRRRATLVAEQSSLQRARRVLPMLAKRQAWLRRRAELADPPLLDADAAAQRLAVQRRLAESERDGRRLESEIAERSQALSAIEFNESLAELDAEMVEDLGARLGSYRKALADLPKRRAELGVLETEAARLARAVGRDGGQVAEFQIEARAQTLVRTLATQRAALDAAIEERNRRLAEVEDARDDVEQRLGAAPAVPSLDALSAALESHRDVAALAARGEEIDTELATIAARQSAAIRTLRPWKGDGAALSSLALPTAATVDDFAKELHALSVAEDDVVRRRREVERRARTNRRDLRVAKAGAAVVGEKDLEAARGDRDAAWQRAKTAKALSKKVIAPVERGMRKSDEIADRLRREADRIAALSSLQAEAESLAAEIGGLDTETAELAARRRDCDRRWRRTSKKLGLEESTPAEVRDWLARAAGVKEAEASRQRLAAEHARLAKTMARVRAELAGAARKLGVKVAQRDSLPRLATKAAAALERWRAQAAEGAALERELAALARDCQRERRALAEQQSKIEAWQRQWRRATALLGAGDELGTEEALAVMDGLVALSAKSAAAQSQRLRVAGIETEVAAFEKEVAVLVAEYADDCRAMPATEAAEALIRHYRTAVAQAETRRRLEGEVAERRRALREIELAGEESEKALAQMMARAGVVDAAALEAAEQRSREAIELDMSIEALERELLDAGEGADLDSLVAQASAVDADVVHARLGELEDEIEVLSDEIGRLQREIGSKEAGLQVLENERGAAAAAVQEQQHMAELVEHVRRYLRLRLAADILEAEVEKYRERHQGPVLRGANALFPELTLGHYRELRVGYDARDEEALLCVRRDGSEVGVAGLSDGTRDQLYLALRLATLQCFSSTNDTLPLVLDDVLVHFDDPRAAAALRVLGELSASMQILFFTHHSRLVDLARHVIPDERRVEHDLDTLRAASAA